tara:strand:- start:43540 stop:44187 length:648 start_codon:yes stop_codon:yes gene_type:complete
MAIYDHQYGDLSYYRVFRAWGGQEHQEYVRIKRSKEAAYKKALEIDARLAKAQKTFTAEQAISPAYHLRSSGQIRGLRRVLVKRKGRSPAEVFELRINVPWEEEIRRTTISISVHGEQKAFLLAIEKICEWYGLKVKSELGQRLQSCLSAYAPLNKRKEVLAQEEKFTTHKKSSKAALVEEKESAAVTDIVLKRAKNELNNLRGGLFKGLKRFTA